MSVVIWVDNTTGNDTTGTGRRAAPYATLIKAQQVAVDGDEIALVASATSYQTDHTVAPQNVSITYRGTSAATTKIKCASAGSDALRIDGARVRLVNITLEGASTSIQSGIRLNAGAWADLFGCVVEAACDRAITWSGSACSVRAEECNFNSRTMTPSGTCTGEFINCSGMASTYQTQDTLGTLGRTGARHLHTFLRSSLFYAAPEFYQPGSREVWVSTTGSSSNWRDGTETLPVDDIYDAIRLPGVRTVVLTNSGGEIYNLATVGNIKLRGRLLDIIGCLDSNDLGPELRFSTVYASGWTDDTGAWYRTATVNPGVCWDSAHTDGAGNWLGLIETASIAACKALNNSYYFDSGASRLYVRMGASVDPTNILQVPVQNHGIEIFSGTYKIRNIKVRGCILNGIFVRAGGYLDILFYEGMTNGGDGLDTQFGAEIYARHCKGMSNGTLDHSAGDGFGIHKKSVGRFEHCISQFNQDDGFSPHDKSDMELISCTSTNNGDRGAVAVDGAFMTISDSLIHDNGGQNISAEDSTTVIVRSTTVYNPGSGQPNIRVITGGNLSLYSVTDNLGALVIPTTQGGGTYTLDLDDREYIRREIINAALIG